MRAGHVEDTYPLCPVQQGILFHCLAAPEEGTYVVQLSCGLRGELDEAAFRQAWQAVVDARPVLRTGFTWKSGSTPLQVVGRRVGLPVRSEDWRGLGAGELEERFAAFLEEDRARGFQLNRAPLLRVALLRTAEQEHRFVWTFHHLLLDGWSYALVLKEVFHAYGALRRGETPAPAPAPPYRDFIAWQAGRDASAAEAFWRGRLRGLANGESRRVAGSAAPGGPRFAEAEARLTAAETAALEQFARRHRLTLNTMVQGAFALLLGRLSGGEEVVFGAVTAGRPAELPGVESMVGVLINTLPVRAEVSSRLTVAAWLQELQRGQGEARAFEHSSLVDVQRWSGLPPGEPLFEAVLVFESYPVDADLAAPARGLEIHGLRSHIRSNYPLNLAVTPGPEMKLKIAHREDLFPAPAARRMLLAAMDLLARLVEDPERPVEEVPLLSAGERQQVLVEWSDTAVEVSAATVVERFLEQAARRPEDVALVWGEESLRYGELAQRAVCVARRLRALGVGAESRVGLCLERSLDLVVGLLGVWQAGGAWVPMDPHHPDARLELLLGDSGATVVVSQGPLAERLRGLGAAEVVCVEEVGEEEITLDGPAPGDLAYLIYTSGTTGRPKAVMVEHRHLSNVLEVAAGSFGFRAGDRMPCLAAFSFDIFLFELLGPLLAGGTSVLYGLRPTLDVEKVASDLEQMSHLHAVPAVMRQLVALVRERGLTPSRLREVFVGGDLVPPDLLEEMRQVFPGAQVRILYGPTEATIICASHRVVGGESKALIGRPLGNARLLLKDRRGREVPVGVAGEIWIGGSGVSRGYGERYYRSGDQARWLADGTLEFLGRSDDQVKVRGFRIELAEVESALAQHPGVRAAAATVKGEALVGYWVGDVAAEPLRQWLESRLPAHMVPSALVELPALPLTAHGKVDRRSLPEPGAEPRGLGAPRTPAEELLAGLWSQVLGVERVGVHDSFFDLGGHSLLATQLISRVRQAFEVELPLARLFEAPTVAGLAEAIAAERGTRRPAAPPVRPVPRTGPLPLSFSQERIWFFEALQPGTATYHLPFGLRLLGPLDPAEVAAVLARIVERHEALRTVFAESGGEPFQVILPAAAPELPVIDLSALPDAARDGALRELAAGEARRPFDLERGPLLRSCLLRCGEAEHALLLSLHHAVSDGWSTGVLLEEVRELWSAARQGRTPALPALPVQYADFAVWQRGWLEGDVLGELTAEWRQRLEGSRPTLDLPVDRPRRPLPDHRGAAAEVTVGEPLAGALRALARRRGATPFMLLLAAFQALLGRISGDGEVNVGTPVAGRTRRELEGLIGCFVNTLVLRGDLSGDPPFTELLARARRVALEAYERQDLPFEKLVEALRPERSLSHAPLFQVMLVLQNAPLGPVELPGLRLEPLRRGAVAVEHDWTLEAWEEGEGLRLSLQYRTDLFDAATVQRALGHLRSLLEGAAAEPQRRLGDLPLLGEAERHALLVEWNESFEEEPAAGPVHAWIAQRAAETPEAPAVLFPGGALSYAELVARSGRLARELLRRGVGPESRVALCVERSPEMAVGILGILAAGAAWLPLDPDWPRERLDWMMEDAGARVLLTREDLAAAAGDGTSTWPAVPVAPGQAAYVIYTSGSTGRPKGAVIPHRALAAYTAVAVRELGLGSADRMLQFASPGFDVVVEELFPAWAAGAAVVLRDPASLATADGLLRVLSEDAVTACELPTAFWHEWVYELARSGRSLPETLRLVIIGGEHVLPERLAAWSRLGVPLAHVYGLTEVTVTSTLHRFAPGEEPPAGPLPVGRPLAGTRALVVDRGLRPVPAGVAGELCLEGAGLGRGYIGRPDLTAERFVPSLTAAGERMYRTGDLARHRADGALEILGRLDAQVKVRGFRVEPGEIEALLGEDPAVREVAVVPRAGAGGVLRLVAYVALAAPGEEAVEELRRHLEERLPDYMVPAAFVPLPSLPRTATGKIDRRALPEPGLERREGEAPRAGTEEIVAGLFEQVLGVADVGRQADFFDLGGHSLLAIRLTSRLREALGVEVSLRSVFEHGTVQALTAEIEAARRSRTAPVLPPLEPLPAAERSGPLPLSFAQQRLWFLDQLAPGDPAYNVPVAVRLHGRLDPGVLAGTLTAIVRRHEVLRTRFAVRDSEPVQVISPPAPQDLPLVDLAALPLRAREEEALRLVAAGAREPFDLAAGPLLWGRLLRLGSGEHVLLVAMHHIVSDAWSMEVLVREVASLYAALAAGSPSPLPEPRVQYADFAAWQRRCLAGDFLEAQLAFWRRELAGASTSLDLPTDRPRLALRSGRGASLGFSVEPALAAALRALRRDGSTLFSALLAAFELLLARATGQDDFCVGAPVAARGALHTEDLIGFFANTLALRARLPAEGTVRDLLLGVRETVLGALAHQEMPFEKLVEEIQPERDLSRQPLFQAVFALERRSEAALSLPGLTLEPLEIPSGAAKFDLSLTLMDAGDALHGVLVYAAGLFDATTAARFVDQLQAALRFLAEEPAGDFRAAPLLAAGERQQVLVEWSDTAVSVSETTAVERFLAQAARRPEDVALVWGEESLRYGELAQRAARLACRLRALGVGAESRVGLCLERSLDLVVGLLGVWQAGGAWVPMDPHHPDARLELLLADSGSTVVVSQRPLAARLRGLGAAEVVCVEEVGEEEITLHGPAPGDLAYLIYTSGTTGRPKAVMVEHRHLANVLEVAARSFGFRAGDRMPCLAAFSFDIFLFELLSPLLAGGTSVLYGLRPTLDVERVAADLGEMSHLHAVPAVMRQLVSLVRERGLKPKRLREVFVGGDLVPPDLLEEMRQAFPGAQVRILYGPTEATIICASHKVVGGESRALLGRPLGNARLLLKDRRGREVPVGAVGEIWIGGSGVSRGYLGQEELTREKFPEVDGARYYRSGDQARWLADGTLEFLGRGDDQVKVRGFRIELAEVEAALSQYPGVRAAAAAVKGEGEARALVGYWVGDVAAEPLRQWLESRLPAHMVPSALVELPALPLTAHGKVDRRSLPEPGEAAVEPGGLVAPRTPTEELLAGLWAQILSRERVGVHDNFFDLGGHSLLATQLISRVRQAFEVELPLARLFEAPTVAGLAEVLETGSSASEKAEMDPIVPVPREGDLPLSFSQERVWFFEQLEPGTSAYNLPLVVRLLGHLPPSLMAAMMREIARRHEPLRTTFRSSGGVPFQVVAPPGEWTVPLVDLTGIPNAEAEAIALGTAEAQRPFDLAAGPVVRIRLLLLAPDDQVVLFNMHHIVSDGWSMGILMRELAKLYEAWKTGVPAELPQLPIQYADYAVWQRGWMQGEVLQDLLRYWREQLDGAPEVIDLPTDRPRPPVLGFRGDTEYFLISLDTMETLHALRRQKGTTLFMVLLAALDCLIVRHTTQQEVVVGSPIANRTRSEVESLIGFFVNTVILRARLDGDPVVGDVLDAVRRSTLGAYAHQDLPFDKLVEALQPDRSFGETPLFQIMFVLQNATTAGDTSEDLQLVPVEVPGELAAEFDWTIELADGAEGLLGSLQYRTELFDRTTIQRIVRRWTVLLAELAAHAGRRLSEIPLLSVSERHQMLAEWVDTSEDAPAESLIHELIAAQADETPDAPAVVAGESGLTYRELVAAARRLARELRRHGVGPESVVALCAERSPEMAVGLLGILEAGGAYVPLDPAYPKDRLAYMLADSGARVLLTQERLRGTLPESGAAVLCLDGAEGGRIAALSDAPLPRAADPDNPAYLIYTSGSTGRPKGAVISHRALAVYCAAIARDLGLHAGDRMLQFASLSFDVAVEEIFPAWVVGAAVVMREPALLATGDGLMRACEEDAVTACELPTAYWHEWVYELARSGRPLPPSLRFVIIGGEHVLPERLAAWGRLNVPLVHVYGLTEVTVTSTTHHVPAGWTPPSPGFVLPIGRPIANSRLVILDRYLGISPLSVPGELCVEGDCLARGYFGRPELTAERFIPSPAPAAPGARLYRTGDLARALPDGRVEFLGRLDHQVKVRGFRVELGEVEAVLGRHPAVREVAVVARKAADGSQRLVAYVALAAGSGGVAELKRHLSEELPDYMVPGAFVPLDALPRTATGKVDRKALPDAAAQGGETWTAPRTQTEELLASLWSQVLNVERIGMADDFFALGGHSLLATRLISRVREAFRIDLPLRVLFEQPTPAHLAEAIEAALRAGRTIAVPPLAPAVRTGPLPLSFAQQRLWFLGQLEPDNPAYNVPVALRVQGDLDAAVLARTITEIVRRHEVLRTRFELRGGEPVQAVAPPEPQTLEVVDLTALPEAEREREAIRLATDEAQRPFDLARDPMLRVRLLPLAPRSLVVLLSMHHIVSDAWSMEVLVGEVAALYAAYLRGEASPLPELPLQYADYAVWQRGWLQGEVLAAHLDYWKAQLEGAAQVLELPTDRPRPSVQSFRGATWSFDLPEALCDRLRDLARQEGATMFMTLLAPLELLLCRYSGQEDFCVGTPIAGRNHLETEDLIGFFVNTLVLRADLRGAGSLRGLLRRVREVTLGAFSHQDLPFERLVEELQPERDLARHPLFQAVFALEHERGDEEPETEMPEGLSFTPLEFEGTAAKFDWALSVIDFGRRLSGGIDYLADLFDPTTVARMARHYEVLVEALVEEPDRAPGDLPLLSASERHQLVREWNDTEEVMDGATVVDRFAAQAGRTPEAEAVIFGEEALSYRELDQRSGRLARRLAALGAGREVRVGLALDRSPDLAAGVLAVWKAGGAFVPMDPLHPDARLRFLLEDSGALLVVAHERSRERLERLAPGVRVVPVDGVDAEDEEPLPRPAPGDLAYLIYTSGTTGRPKAVLVEHGNLAAVLGAAQRRFGFREGDRMPCLAACSFDIFLFELLNPLLAGGTAELFGLEPTLDVDLLAGRLWEMTHLHAVPAVMRQIAAAARARAAEWGTQPPLREVFCGGDLVPPDLLAELAEVFPAARRHILYGPTEATIIATSHCAADDAGEAPIGRPLPGARLRLVGLSGQLAPAGAVGEIWIGGAGVGRGYLGEEELTREKFPTVDGERFYRTGDLGRWLPDGTLEFLGRLDDQVKIRGVRIEPGEVEAALRQHPRVREAAVAPWGEGEARRLAGYYLAEPPGEIPVEELRSFLRERLPEALVPSAFVALPELPLTAHGKVDRRALPEPEGAAAEFVAPRTPTEELLAGVWAGLLGAGRVGANDNFFDLGGHSLLATQLASRVRESFGVELPLRAVFDGPTLAELAARVEELVLADVAAMSEEEAAAQLAAGDLEDSCP